MKKFATILVFSSMLFLFTSALGQSNNTTIDGLLCKEWKLIAYEESGNRFPPAPEQKGDRMILYRDHKVKSIEVGNIQNGIWHYDSTKKVLTIVDNETKDKAILKVTKISETECVLEYKDSEGTLLKMYMVPVVAP